MSKEYTLAELEEQYFPERMERLVDCPVCSGALSMAWINDPCQLCWGKGRVKYRIYRDYWRNKNDPPPTMKG